MLHKVKDRIGTAGLIVATMAMAMALVGGAYAASGGLTSKQKKEVKAIAKSFQGTGPAGPQGLAGSPGAKGNDGDEGPPGKDGKAGKDGADGTEGKEGSPWTAGGTLPPGATEVGNWTFSASSPEIKVDVEGTTEEIEIGNSFANAPISFPIKYPFNLKAAHVHYGFQESGGAFSIGGACPGKIFTPEAAPGELCVYESEGSVTGATFSAINRTVVGLGGASASGAFVLFTLGSGPASGGGSFAVTSCKVGGGPFECPAGS